MIKNASGSCGIELGLSFVQCYNKVETDYLIPLRTMIIQKLIRFTFLSQKMPMTRMTKTYLIHIPQLSRTLLMEIRLIPEHRIVVRTMLLVRNKNFCSS